MIPKSLAKVLNIYEIVKLRLKKGLIFKTNSKLLYIFSSFFVAYMYICFSCFCFFIASISND